MLSWSGVKTSITTVEGLADGAHLAPIQACFAKYGGSQCGFYARFLVASQALLVDNPSPTDQEIAEAIEGNLCRCTGYQQIIESIQEAAKIHRGEVAPPTPASDPHPIPIRVAWRAVDASWPRSEYYVSRVSSTTG